MPLSLYQLSKLTTFLNTIWHKAIIGVSYIKARMGEKSTWIMFGAAIAGASSLPAPWSYFSLVVGVIAGMCPDVRHNNC